MTGGEREGGAVPFIEIPTARSEGGQQESTTSGNTTAANPTAPTQQRQTPLNPVAGQ